MKTSYVLAGALLTGVFAACSVKTTKGNAAAGAGGAGAVVAASSSGVGPGPQSSVMSSSASGMTGCYDETGIVGFTVPPTTIVKQMVCTAQQFNDYMKNCVLMGATQATCDMFQKDMANAKCLACMTGDGKSTSPPALVIFPTPDMKALIYGNRAGCEALVEGKPQCGGPLTSLVLCEESACQGCKSNADFMACTTAAEAGACKDLKTKLSAECAMVGSKGFDMKCDGKDFATIAANVVAAICE